MVAALTQLAGSCTAPFVVDRAGRRPLALVGFSVLLVIDVIAGALSFFTNRGPSVLQAIAAMGFIFVRSSDRASDAWANPTRRTSPGAAASTP